MPERTVPADPDANRIGPAVAELAAGAGDVAINPANYHFDDGAFLPRSPVAAALERHRGKGPWHHAARKMAARSSSPVVSVTQRIIPLVRILDLEAGNASAVLTTSRARSQTGRQQWPV